ncbi:MAG: cytochrome d ubiquinol oxidase subunit II [Acidobacteriota bacterium]
METIWFCLIALMLAVYVVLDGFDLGAGIVHLLVARTDRERRTVLRSIGPVWDGNGVWLLAAAGSLFLAFPALYASSFSGFYLPLMIVLWLLVLRGVAVEFRNHIDSPAWKPFWDVVFAGASLLLALFYGTALGCVVRGVPLDASGYFFEPLWTDFRLGRETGIIDWYTALVGLLAILALTVHGSLWVALKTGEPTRRRARRVARRAWWGVAVLTAAVTAVTFRVQANVPARLAAQPWGYLFPALALGGLLAIRWLGRDGADLGAFLASCSYLAGMMASVAFGLYPYVLPASTGPGLSLTARGAAAGAYGLRAGLLWWIPGVVLAAGYFALAYRRFAGKVSLEEEGY